MCIKSVSFHLVWWWDISHGSAVISALPSYQQRWDAAFLGSVCLLFPALRFWHLHLFLPFVGCVLLSPLCGALGRAMKGVAAACHWVIRRGTNESLDLRASRSPLCLGGTSVKLSWLALGSRRFPAQRSLARCPAFSVSSGAAQRSGVPCGALLSWVGLPGKSLLPRCALLSWMSLSSLASLVLSGGTRCATTGTCLWRTWKFPSQKRSDKSREQQTDTAAGELWTWFGGRGALLFYFYWGVHTCNPGRDFGDWCLFRCSCSTKAGSSGTG